MLHVILAEVKPVDVATYFSAGNDTWELLESHVFPVIHHLITGKLFPLYLGAHALVASARRALRLRKGGPR